MNRCLACGATSYPRISNLNSIGLDLITIAVQARQTIEESQWLLGLAATCPFILGVVGWVDLKSDNVRSQLARLAANSKLLGVRHIVQSELDERFLLQPELVSRFPDQRFVLDHLARPPIKDGSLQPWENTIRNLARFPSVVCKVSGLVTEADWKSWELAHLAPYIEVALDCFDPERLMIGSDRPVCTLAASYLQVIDAMQEFLSQYPPSVSNAVLGGTASNFWELTTRTKDSHAGVDTSEVLAEKSELRQSENRL